MKTQYEYIHFLKTGDSPSGKTSRWNCYNNTSHEKIGGVYWYGQWRQYIFAPVAQTVFSTGCLADIQSFMGELEAERKAR